MLYFLSYGYYRGLKQQKGPSASLKVIGNLDFVLVFHCNYVSILHHFQDIIDYLLKFKEATWHNHAHLRDYLSIGRLILNMANQCTKFEVFSLSHSSDILGGIKI